MFTKSNRPERIKLCFRFCDFTDSGVVSWEELKVAVSMFDHMYNGMRSESKETEVFVQMASEKQKSFDKDPEDDTSSEESSGLTYEQFWEVIILHPLFVNFFRLDEMQL